MEFSQIVRERRSVRLYDENHSISDEELRDIFEKVSLTPSSFNLQHWRFVVVRDQAIKEQIKAAAWNQEQVGAASAVVLVAGKLRAYEDAEFIYREAPQDVREQLVPTIAGYYEGKPGPQRDEAIRSGSLAAMTLMYAAQDLGYASGPMIGFDPAAVGEILSLPEDHVPVMLVVIGKQVGELRPRAFRFPLEDVVKLDSFEGPGLK